MVFFSVLLNLLELFFFFFFTSESALSFPHIPRWLGIQQKIISLYLDKSYTLFSTCGWRVSYVFIFFKTASTDKGCENNEFIMVAINLALDLITTINYFGTIYGS